VLGVFGVGVMPIRLTSTSGNSGIN